MSKSILHYCVNAKKNLKELLWVWIFLLHSIVGVVREYLRGLCHKSHCFEEQTYMASYHVRGILIQHLLFMETNEPPTG